MKELNQYIIEKLKINKNSIKYHYYPTNRAEIRSLIEKLIE